MVLVCFASLTVTWTALELTDILLSHDCVRVAAPPRQELDRQVEKAAGPV